MTLGNAFSFSFLIFCVLVVIVKHLLDIRFPMCVVPVRHLPSAHAHTQGPTLTIIPVMLVYGVQTPVSFSEKTFPYMSNYFFFKFYVCRKLIKTSV